MKVLYITTWYPSKQKISGTLFVKEHVRAIKGAGVDITVLFLNINYSASFFKTNIEYFKDENDIPIIRVNIFSCFHNIIHQLTPYLYSKVKKEVSKLSNQGQQFDIIHANVISPCGIMAHWLSKRLNIPYIITEHWTQLTRFFSKNFFSSAGKKAYSNANAVTVVSEYLKSQVIQFAPLSAKNVSVIPNVIDESVFYFTPRQPDKDQVIFSALATWDGNKRPEIFIEALNRAQALTDKKIVLKIGGTGIRLENALKRTDLSITIEELGPISKAKAGELVRNSDFFVHATVMETFSVVIAEALLAGTPVIASNIEPLPKLVQNKRLGLLCENNIDDWVAKIVKAISTNFDRQYIADFHKGKFTVQQVGKEFNQLYKEVLSKKRE